MPTDLGSKDKEITKLKEQGEKYKSQIADLKISLASSEKEKDFYFNKLKEIEFYVDSAQHTEEVNLEAQTILQHIHRILFEHDI